MDTFCWKLYNSFLTPDQFAWRLCNDLNLPQCFQSRISMQISEQVATIGQYFLSEQSHTTLSMPDFQYVTVVK